MYKMKLLPGNHQKHDCDCHSELWVDLSGMRGSSISLCVLTCIVATQFRSLPCLGAVVEGLSYSCTRQ